MKSTNSGPPLSVTVALATGVALLSLVGIMASGKDFGAATPVDAIVQDAVATPSVVTAFVPAPSITVAPDTILAPLFPPQPSATASSSATQPPAASASPPASPTTSDPGPLAAPAPPDASTASDPAPVAAQPPAETPAAPPERTGEKIVVLVPVQTNATTRAS